jgi:hypothetical protein
MKRNSFSSLGTFKVPNTVREDGGKFCIGCFKRLSNEMCYEGSVIAGQGNAVKHSTEHTPILGVMETPEQTYILGGQAYETVKKVSFVKRNKGLVCVNCAGNYKTVRYGSTEHPVVKVDRQVTVGDQKDYGDRWQEPMPVEVTVRKGLL